MQAIIVYIITLLAFSYLLKYLKDAATIGDIPKKCAQCALMAAPPLKQNKTGATKNIEIKHSS